MKTTQEQRDELRKLAEAATPGPWKAEKYGITGAGDRDVVSWDYALNDTDRGSEGTDKEFIASASPTTILALLDDLAAMTERAEKAERGLRILRECTAAERDRIYGDAMAKLRAELARRTVERDSHCEHANQESSRASDYAESNESLRTALASAEATIAKLREAMPSEAERRMAEAVMDELRYTAGGYRASDIIAPWLARLDAARKEVG